MPNRPIAGPALLLAAFIIASVSLAGSVSAQSLNLEGQTGGMATPFAYVIESRPGHVGAPAAGFHWLKGGDKVGNRFQMSLIIGFLGRLEVGYTKGAVSHASEGSIDTDEVAKIFDRGFMIVHAKAMLVPENSGGTNAPAVSVGFAYRFQRSSLEGVPGSQVKNGDVYVVATKTIGQIKQAPIVISGGVKGTNATPFSFAGNSTGWVARGFVFGGLKLGGKVLVGAEYAQQPREIDGVPDVNMPATTAFLVRLVPDPKGKLSLEASLVSLGGDIGGGVDIKANNRFALGIGYRF
jgi:hypothetical protein